MSFILDALKKSQASRQKHAGPRTITVETAPRPQQQHNWWAVVIAIVLINLTAITGLIYWNSRDKQADPAQDMTRPASGLVTPNSGSTGQASTSGPPDQNAATRLPVERGEVSPLSAEVKEPRVTPPALPTATARPTQGSSTPAPATVTAPASDSDYLPTLTELQLANRIAVSPMHVDVHVFNEDPQRRFVLINTRKYKEGERMTEGPLLESIRRDGVVLYYRGQRFLLPRD